MSHQTGIKANIQLKKFFGKCRDSKIRVMKINIEHEELCLSTYKETKGSWREDYDKYVREMIQPSQPCYILFRLDTRHETGGYNWLLLSWSPDDSHIRQKMLYASTKATLKQEFGSSHIKEEMHATLEEEVSVAGLERHRAVVSAPGPKTQREEELSSELCQLSVETKPQSIGSVAMPLVDKAKQELMRLGTDYNYIRLRIDLKDEKIELDTAKSIEVEQLCKEVPENSARYHLFRYFYFHQARRQEATFFIYSMPGYSCPIKERMLYSSCVGPLIDNIKNSLSIKIDKKLEVDSGKDLTAEALYEELHPKSDPMAGKAKFDKPKGPPNRGARRINKTSHQ